VSISYANVLGFWGLIEVDDIFLLVLHVNPNLVVALLVGIIYSRISCRSLQFRVDSRTGSDWNLAHLVFGLALVLGCRDDKDTAVQVGIEALQVDSRIQGESLGKLGSKLGVIGFVAPLSTYAMPMTTTERYNEKRFLS
jgi:hypothetical protein